MTDIKQLINAVDSKKVHQIRCGDHRFIDITIVQTEGRFFCASVQVRQTQFVRCFLATPSTTLK